MTKVVLFGVGGTAREITRQLQERGVPVVGAFSRKSGIGTDFGEYCGLDPTGCRISTTPEDDLPTIGADVAVVTTGSSLDGQVRIVEMCLRNGLDVLSLAEEGFHPTDDGTRRVAARLDRTAREAGKSVFFGGIQDVFWHSAVLGLLAGGHRVDSLRCVSTSDLEDLGARTLAEYPLCLTAEQFAAERDTPPGPGSGGRFVMAPAVEALAVALGARVVDRHRRIEPIVAPVDIRSTVLGRTITKGTTCGICERVTLVTDDGTTVDASFRSEVLGGRFEPHIRWTVTGDPSYVMQFENFPGYEATAASLINRIPGVVAAAPGYVTVNDLPAARRWTAIVPDTAAPVAGAGA